MSKPLIYLVLAVTFGLVAFDALWLAQASFTIAENALRTVAIAVATLLGAAGICALIGWRLAGDTGRIASVLTYGSRATILIGVMGAVMIMASTAMLIANYLMMSLEFPLQDDLFSSLDQNIGFDWTAFLGWVNAQPVLSQILVTAYATSLPQMMAVIFVFGALNRVDRLLEFAALYIFAGGLVGLIAMLLPAAGAYAVYQPDAALYTQMSNLGRVHIETIEALRAGTFEVLDFENTVGMVSFPSFHTVLAIIVTYAFRGTLLFWPALVLNVLVVISTLPEGGHYLVDLFGGAAVTVLSIAVVRALSRERVGQSALVQQPA